jgi:PAS domain S-box-containing protein
MNPSLRFDADVDRSFRVLWEDGDRIFCRGHRGSADGDRDTVLAVLPATEHPTPASLDRLAHEYGLKDELDAAWAVRPLELVRERGRTMLVLEDPGSEPLGRLLGAPLELGRFLRLASGITSALGKAHRRGLVHKDIKPANILVNSMTGEVKLTGFGIASSLPRARQAPEPPETIAGTLAYMAPEQTGRMNRSIDTRSDLYALGVTFYQMATGSLPFTAADPIEWVHCHVAKRPTPPCERLESVPIQVSAMIMKLLAKTAEERYQTAAGLESDLQRCLAEWEGRGRVDPFPLGVHDIVDRLLIPEKLYGRAREIETLFAAFDRVVKSGALELVLVSGYSGIGKSSVVNELHKVLVPPRGLFAAGKFDQHKRDIPYMTLVQAFQSLVRPLLSKSDAELSGWRDGFQQALGPNGRLMVDLVPELALIIGEPPQVPELEPLHAQRRFQLVLRRFIGVFARPEHPLALFLDDLQWLDGATLDLLEDLLTLPDMQHLILIGAYRDNEVDAAHPLRRRLEAIRQAGARVQEITLAPLVREHLGQLIADALRCEPECAMPLADLVHDKTGGNPFFAVQFLSALAEEGSLTFDYDGARWSWDLDRIHAKQHTDNVVDLLVRKLTQLPVECQSALQELAAVGNGVEIRTLCLIRGIPEQALHAELWPALRLELIVRRESSYEFAHDRVLEAAYSLIGEPLRAEAHLRIGRSLLAHTLPETIAEHVFEIVNQLNRGAELIRSPHEREQQAELNLLAGRRAKASAAYGSALNYLTTGAALVADDVWERRYELIFALELDRAECEFLTGALSQAEQRLEVLSSRSTNKLDRARVACLRAGLYITLGQYARAVAVGLDYLRHLGVDWSPHPMEDEARRKYEGICARLESCTIEDLVALPLMRDPDSLATIDVLLKIGTPAFHTHQNLFCLTVCRALELSLEQGNSDGSCVAYVGLGLIAGWRFGDYKAAFRFGEIGYELSERLGLTRYQPRIYHHLSVDFAPFAGHFGARLLRRAFDIANRDGDLMFAGHSFAVLIENLLAAGEPLAEVQREAEHGLEFVRKMRFSFDYVVASLATLMGLIRMLRGSTSRFGCLNHELLDEREMEQHFSGSSEQVLPEPRYWIRKLQARFFAGDYDNATEASRQAHRLLPIVPTTVLRADYHFYAALCHAASCDPGEHPSLMEALAAHREQLQVWAENCPENFENRAALVGAEIARIEGRKLDAIELYEQAIRSARDNGFIHHEALAYELAARFYIAHGFEDIATLYQRNARHGYLRWGADGKVRQLDELYPHLREEARAPAPTTTIGASVEHLDLATVLKVSQAVSGEIVLEKLIDTLMRTAVEYAGADRGLLVLPQGAELRSRAEATTGGSSVTIELHDTPISGAELPESVVWYAARTHQIVILDDASARGSFCTDEYIVRKHARSVLCLPLVKQGKPVAFLYLENNIAPSVFTPARITVLKLLASEAATSLENGRLYREVQEREAKIRRLVDANIIGIFISRRSGEIIEANDAFLKMVGYGREDLTKGNMSWTDLTPPEWRASTARALEGIDTIGVVQPYEKEYLRKDGSRVPVLVGAAALDELRDQGVTFVLDLTERKHAEAEARESERRYREVQTELAHANRVATMGQLTASIAHEVKQPISAAVTDAEAALRWLGRRPPELEKVRESLESIVETGHRAGDVVDRIRALIKKAPARKKRLDLNHAIREVSELTHGEAVKNRVSVQTDLADDLPLIGGDRVQLQQVILNLIMNAIEAMSGVDKGTRELLISTRKAEPSGVLVGVRDSGPGLAPATLEHVFDAFYTTKSSGLGMGLSICRSIVEAHGGRLWASANVPRGATFEFTLPASLDIES